MRTFKDSEGREWAIAINVATARRVKDLAGVDLLSASDGKLLHELADDPMLLANVLWAIVQPQAQSRNVSDEQFGEALSGESIDKATTALLQELVDFFPAHRRGPMQAALGKLTTMLDRSAAVALERVNAIDVEAILATLGKPSTSLPESSASTPDR